MMMEARSAAQVARLCGLPTGGHSHAAAGQWLNLLIDDAGFDGLVIHFGEGFAQAALSNVLTARPALR